MNLHKIISLFIFISFLSVKSLLGIAPESILNKKITFSITGDTEVIFYPTANDRVYSYEKSSGEWYFEKINWNKISTNKVTLSLQGDSTIVDITFETDSSGSFKYSSDDGDSGEGTFSTSTFTTDEIPINRYFNDTFSNATKSKELWPLESYSGIRKDLNAGSLVISGTLTDHEERWYNINCNTLLNSKNNWVIKGSAHTDVSYTQYVESDTWYYNDATIGIFISSLSGDEVEFNVGISHNNIVSSIWVDKTKQYKSASISSTSRSGSFRLVNSPNNMTVSSQYKSGGSWEIIHELNLETGVLTNLNNSFTFTDWNSLKNASINPGIRFEIPHLKNNSDGEFNKLVPFNKGDIGFSSFSITGDGENATTYNSETEDFIQQNNSKGWMWFDHYPWVYSSKENGWLYFYPRDSGKIYIYNQKQNSWQLLDR